jgi:hypothetical protein
VVLIILLETVLIVSFVGGLEIFFKSYQKKKNEEFFKNL